MSIGEEVSTVLVGALDADQGLAEQLHAADVVTLLGACGVQVTADEVRRATRRRRDARSLARRLGVPARALRRWLRGGGDLPIRAADPPEIVRCGR